MKKLVMAFLLTITSVLIANAGNPPKANPVQNTVLCTDVELLMNYLRDEYGEQMVWVGKTIVVDSYIALYKNKDKGTWTMIQYDGRMGCVLGAGETGSPT